MTRAASAPVLVLALAAAALAGCRSHPVDAVELTGQTCVACHQADYQAAPDHPGRYPETCGDCHRTDAWRPALGFGHPEAAFPIEQGEHDVVACLDCHDVDRGPSTDGANTDCIGCHTGDHTQAETDPQHGGVPDYAFELGVPNFCLRCHPDGTAPDHPEAAFPIQSGPHGFACGDCHVAALGPSTGGMNVSCIGCHTGDHARAKMDEHHLGEVDGYAWDDANPDFCRECHPRGDND